MDAKGPLTLSLYCLSKVFFMLEINLSDCFVKISQESRLCHAESLVAFHVHHQYRQSVKEKRLHPLNYYPR